jgi:hypothetical protein
VTLLGLQAHAIPRNDLVEHELSDECVCGPAVTFLGGGAVVVHHSLDGRELSEKEDTRDTQG